MSDPSRVHVCGVLERFKVGFAIELARQGYAPRACMCQLYLMAHLSRWLTEQGLQLSELPRHAAQFLSPRDVTTFVVARTPKQSRPAAKPTMTALRSFLRFLVIGRPRR
jgi:hypothetical protein